MLTHCSSKTKDRAVLQFMAGKITSIQIDWQPEEGLYVCSLMNVVDTDEKSWRWAGWKVGVNERKPQTEGAGKSWTTKRQRGKKMNAVVWSLRKDFRLRRVSQPWGKMFSSSESTLCEPHAQPPSGEPLSRAGGSAPSWLQLKEGVCLLKSWSQNWRHWYQSADSWGLERVKEETARRLVVI